MKHDLTRVVYLIGLVFGFLAVTVGLNVVQAATYEGQWTKIILDRVNASSLDLKGTATLTGPDLTPKSYNLPATISAGRLAKLARGFLRSGVYGLAIDAAMTSADWIWDNALKNWKKIITQGGQTCSQYPPTPTSGCITGIYKEGTYSCTLYDYQTFSICQTTPFVPPSGYSAYAICSSFSCCVTGTCYSQNKSIFRKVITPPPLQNIDVPATDQDIFVDGVKNVPSAIPDLITGLPQVIGTPVSDLSRATNIININWPEIVNILNTLVSTVNVNLNIQNVIDKAISEGIQSLTPDETNILNQNNIDINTLIQALTNTQNNVQLTPDQQTQIDRVTGLQNPTNLVVPTLGLTEVIIPTDCDLIPFVCAWLEWYRGWLTQEPPPVPEVVIPIEELDDFDPGNGPSGSCPAPYQFSVFSRSYEVSYQPFCDLALLLNPLIIAMAWLISGYIVTRSR